MKRLFLVLPLLLFTVSCSDSDLQKVAQDMVVVSNALAQVQTDTIAANTAGLINDDVTTKILQICMRANATGKQIDSILRNLSKLDPASRGSVIALLTPISQSLDPTQLEFIAGIKNEGTKQKVAEGFILARSTISSIQLILASGG
jgi:hypothetical protein